MEGGVATRELGSVPDANNSQGHRTSPRQNLCCYKSSSPEVETARRRLSA
jgi:hypothetical protein